MRGFKFPSRNKVRNNITHIECPYCHDKYKVEDETEEDYDMVYNTKLHYCRKCGEPFVNNITKDVQYKYS